MNNGVSVGLVCSNASVDAKARFAFPESGAPMNETCMSQFTLQDAVSSSAFLALDKSADLPPDRPETEHQQEFATAFGFRITERLLTSRRPRLEHRVLSKLGKVHIAGPHCGTIGAAMENGQVQRLALMRICFVKTCALSELSEVSTLLLRLGWGKCAP